MNVTITSDLGENKFELCSKSAIDLVQYAFKLRLAEEEHDEAKRAEEFKKEKILKKEYKGFLIVKCKECGEIKSYCGKHYQSSYICDCGAKTEFKNMKPVYVNCSCGASFRYQTNLEDDMFEFQCLDCKDKVNLYYNSEQNCYESL